MGFNERDMIKRRRPIVATEGSNRVADAEQAEREACAAAMDEWEASESIASPAAIIRARRQS